MENRKGSLYFQAQIRFHFRNIFSEEHESSSRVVFYSTLFNSLEVNSSFISCIVLKPMSRGRVRLGHFNLHLKSEADHHNKNMV
jgi:hypothetical protein